MVEIGFGALGVAVFAVLLAWWSRAAQKGRLPRNWILGYRSRLTMRDTRAWREVNAATSLPLAVAATGAAVGAVVAVIIAVTGSAASAAGALGLGLVWALVWVLGGLVPAHRVARRLARTTRPRP